MTSPASTHRFIRPGQVSPDQPAPDACMECGQPEAKHNPDRGPFETEQEARQSPAVRRVYAEFDANPGPGHMATMNLAILADACVDAGIGDDLGAYDLRILEWIAATWEPATCAVIAGLITRAAER